ncbi:MAG TPA: autotransporter outer membrane beta-barrel domain-containing protein [Steroidobacteraceae bacterium]|nr:autotransporter outer membrane beta-barrel domain-containing protein [Steroidobacteraceae bacterium]
MGDRTNDSTAKAVRRILLASAALAPAFFISPQAMAQSPSVDAGPNRNVPNSDGVPGETVTLQGSGQSNTSGGSLSFVWTNAQQQQIATGATPTVRLPTGDNQLFLTVNDSGNSSSSSDVVLIRVDFAGRMETAGRTPNAKLVGRTLDDLCDRLTANLGEGQSPYQGDTNNLAQRCADFNNAEVAATEFANGVSELGAQDFNSLRTLAIEFSQTQYQSVMDRLQSLRQGQRGISLAGLTINSGGQSISGDQIASSLKQALGGGAAADGSGDIFGDKLGFWARGNFGTGEKEASLADVGFEADQFGLTLGSDYRFSSNSVLGVSLGFGGSSVDFNQNGGGLDSASIAGSLYGSAYFGGFYVDAVVNYIAGGYDTERKINYDLGDPVNLVAKGETDASTLSGGLAVGYDFALGAFTIAPSIGYYYVDASIDEFREHGAAGLDLSFYDQDYKSSTANAGLRMSYAWKTSWGVVLPHFRGTFVKEFEDDVQVFNVRFANDPFTGTADPTAPIAVSSDAIDDSYIRLAAGVSAQFKSGFSGYFEYQRIQGYENVSFQDATVGVRYQLGF